MSNFTISIFGANGDMGSNLLVPLLQKHATVQTITKESSTAEITLAWKADLIILSVPQPVIKELLTGVTLLRNQVVLEICSVKQDVQEIITAAGGTCMSLHPMNGPYVPWTKQKWLIIGDTPNLPAANLFMDALRAKHVLFHIIPTVKEHDLLMSMTLGLPQMVNTLIATFIKQSLLSNPDVDITLQKILQTCSPGSASLFNAFLHTVHSIPLWLKEELLLNSDPTMHQNCLDTFATLADKNFYNDTQNVLQQQEDLAKNIIAPTNFLTSVRDNSIKNFNTFNEYFLENHKTVSSNIYVQKNATPEEVLSGEKTTIGIHGIKGSFTDEAWHRFCKEVLGVDEQLFTVVELTHSENVLRAVECKEVDRGIFAFANSGSGGYMASIQAMGIYNYTLLSSFTMPINMCILSHPSVTSIHEIDYFYGHPIALSQCRITLEQRWPDIQISACTDEMDTALSAKMLAEGQIPPNKAIFASKRAAEIYGLTILAEAVHHDPNNATSFAVIRAL